MRTGDADSVHVGTLERRIREHFLLPEQPPQPPQQQRWLSVRSLHTIGEFWRLRGDLREALKCFRLVLVLRPHAPAILHSIARALLHLRLDAEAEQLIRRTLLRQRNRHWQRRRRPRCCWQQLYTLAQIQWRARRPAHAMRLARRALQLHPRHRQLYDLLHELERERADRLNVYFQFLWRVAFYGGVFAAIRAVFLAWMEM